MKSYLLSLGLVFLCAGISRADLVVVQKVEGLNHSQTAEMTLKVKGDKIRADVTRDLSTIMDVASGETTTLMHPQRAYMQISAEAAGQLMGRLHENKDAAVEPATPQATGKHEAVNGQDTEVYTSRIGQMKITYWIAKDFPDAEKVRTLFKQLQNSPLAKLTQDSMVRQPIDLPGVAVKTRMEMPNGQKLTVTLISVKEQTLENAEFEIPRNYQALPSPAFGSPTQKHP